MSELKLNKTAKIIIALALTLIALISIVNITPLAVAKSTHAKSIKQIDQEISTVLELSAGAAGASAVLSLLPDDTCTPVANQLAEFGTYFLIVLSALFFEKYMITTVGYLSFTIIVPVICLLLGIGIIGRKKSFNYFAVKLMVVALALYFALPLSVKVSEVIYRNYESSIQETINEATTIGDNGKTSEGSNQIKEWIKESSEKVVDYISNMLSSFVEALAVMIVTACVIPILVLVFVFWLIKAIFGIKSKDAI